jgi:hypothetical protein
MSDFDFTALLHKEMAWAIEQKRACAVDRQDDFNMRVKVVGPIGQIATTPLRWEDEDQKRACMRAVSATCKIMMAQGVVVASDTRHYNMPKFCEFFHIPEPHTAEESKIWEIERRRIMKPYDYYIGNLPRALWLEALMVMARGPRVNLAMRSEYNVVDRTFVFETPVLISEQIDIRMVPPWWD